MGLMEHASPRYEADDLIGTLVEHGRQQGRPSTIVTRDKDLTQLLAKDDVFWDFAGKGKLGYDQIPGSFGVWPEQIADFLALAGDAVDNIKGVPGVGKKTAEGLLKHFGSLDEIYGNLDRVHEVNVRGSKTLAAKLEMHREDAMLARRLTGIACDAPIENAEKALQPSAPSWVILTRSTMRPALAQRCAARPSAFRISTGTRSHCAPPLQFGDSLITLRWADVVSYPPEDMRRVVACVRCFGTDS